MVHHTVQRHCQCVLPLPATGSGGVGNFRLLQVRHSHHSDDGLLFIPRIYRYSSEY